MNALFYAKINFNEPLNNWNVSNVTDMRNMFGDCRNFNQPLDNWDVSNVKTMYGTFTNCWKFNQPLNNWNVSNVTTMYCMFINCRNFNQPLNNWNVSNVKTMSSMFYECRTFNQPLNNWNVSNVLYYNDMFRHSDMENTPILHPPFVQEFQTQSILTIQSPLQLSNSFINIHTDQGMDLVNLNNVIIYDYLKENINHIVFYFQGKVSCLTSREQLNEFTTKLSYINSIIKFGCKQIGTSIVPRRENLDLEEAYFTMKSLGSYGLVKLSQINTIIADTSIRCIEISPEPLWELPSKASYQMIFSSTPDAIGSSHCQEGQNENVYDLLKINVEFTGGKKN
jgi:surface protein